MGSLPSKPTSNSINSNATPLQLPPHGLIQYRTDQESSPPSDPSRYPLLACLSDLPNELLLEITRYLTSTRDVYALLRVNRSLAILLPHVLSAMLLQIYNGSTRRSLFSVSTQHSESLVLRLLSLGIDLDAVLCNCKIGLPQSCRCGPPLHSAIAHSNRHMVATLLRHGASITVRSSDTGDNAVHRAIHLNSGIFRVPQENDMAILLMLLDGGRLKAMNSPAAINNDGETWLNMAVRRCPPRDVTLVMPFLVRGLDVNVADNRRLLTPLHIAINNSRPDLAKMLLQRGAQYHTVNSMGVTPFAAACSSPNCEVIDLLLSRDAGLIKTVVNSRGETAEDAHVAKAKEVGSRE
ncbi:B-cell lymphoma 3 protein [Maublancomyces gigas]|uniref:B-cell lymphoma 3 protein n=1 Tax=Discina gigas TaxID=1032678 RepID=A0ABR3GBD0_9PEZI